LQSDRHRAARRRRQLEAAEPQFLAEAEQPEEFAEHALAQHARRGAVSVRVTQDVFERVGGPVIAVERVPPEDVSSYGIVAIDDSDLGHGVHRIVDLVEKPPREEAPSNLAIIGRYILTPDIFPALQDTASDRTGEIQLTNGMRRLLQKRPLYACEISGVRHDAGNKLGFLKATAYFALKRPEFAEAFRRYVETLDKPVGTTR